MESNQTILLATPDELLATRLNKALEGAGYQVTCARDRDQAFETLASGQTHSLILDSQWMEQPVEQTLERISEATGSLEGGFLALYDPSQPFDFQAARAGGVT
ncbi:MAG TPA: hypothetical protein PLJ12_05940, partial [Planctomycetota bacterium]|nr:hypothetical protein [Planctomycetota bacterium]